MVLYPVSPLFAHTVLGNSQQTVQKSTPECTEHRQLDTRCTGEKHTGGKTKFILLCVESALLCSAAPAPVGARSPS